MDNLGVIIGALVFRGSPEISNSYSPIPFTVAALNAILVLISFCKLRVYKKSLIYAQIFVASVVGTLCCILYFGVETKDGRGFIVLNTFYHSLIWLSCLNLFPKYNDIFHDSGTSKTAADIITCLAYLWSLISVIIAIFAEVNKANMFSYSLWEYLYAGYDGNFVPDDSVVKFFRVFQFICYCNWFYVLCFIILLIRYLPTFNKVSKGLKKFLIAIFMLQTTSVITDTAMIVSGGRMDGNGSISILVISFIFVDFFTFLSLCIILFYSERWARFIGESKKEALPS